MIKEAVKLINDIDEKDIVIFNSDEQEDVKGIGVPLSSIAKNIHLKA